MTRYSPYGIEVLPDGGALLLVGGVTEQSIDTGVEVNAEMTAGSVSPQFGEINVANSGGRFTTHAINAVLGAIGLEGACLTGDDDVGFAVWTLKREPCGSLSSGSVHRKLVIPNGRIVPISLSIQQGKRAALVCQVNSLYDGTNLPLLIQTAKAAPTGLDDAVGFHLGEVKIANITLEHVTGLEINFGNEVTPNYDSGEIYPTSLHIAAHKPTLTISTSAPGGFDSSGIELTGKHSTHLNSSIVLRRRILGTGTFSDAAEHIKFTVDGVCHYKEFAASGNNQWTASVMVTALDDGTNRPLVADYVYDMTP